MVLRHHPQSCPHMCERGNAPCRSLNERRETAAPSSGKAILDGLYAFMCRPIPPHVCEERTVGTDQGLAS